MRLCTDLGYQGGQGGRKHNLNLTGVSRRIRSSGPAWDTWDSLQNQNNKNRIRVN